MQSMQAPREGPTGGHREIQEARSTKENEKEGENDESVYGAVRAAYEREQ